MSEEEYVKNEAGRSKKLKKSGKEEQEEVKGDVKTRDKF